MTNSIPPPSSLHPRDRLARARLVLEGLSVGDAFGEEFFVPAEEVERHVARRELFPAPWRWTDDTAMALGIYEVLARSGRVDADELATVFARNYAADPYRGYGGGAHRILTAIGRGQHWNAVAGAEFSGQGSMGNGGAMRAAPVGAYFASEGLDRVVAEARISAEVTHAHAEGQAGAIAVAVAAACAERVGSGDVQLEDAGGWLLDEATASTPPGATRDGLQRVIELGARVQVSTVVAAVGNGSGVVAPDTVPLALWCAARHLDSYEDALWTTVSALGDRDTTCAIVGGIVALAVGEAGIPAEWRSRREALPSLEVEGGQVEEGGRE